MILDPVTVRWAGALFNLAQRNDALEQVRKDVETIGVEMQSPAVRAFLLGGEHSADEKRAKLNLVTNSFHELTINTINLLLDRRREGVLEHLAEAFRQRLMEEAGQVEGVVECARELGTAEIDQLATALGAQLGKTVSLTTIVNSELVGGFRVTVGAKQIDFSVQGRLEALRTRLLEAPLPAAGA